MKLGPRQKALLLVLARGPRKAPDIWSGRETECVAALKRLRVRGLVSTSSPDDSVSTWTTFWHLTAAGLEAIGK